MTILNMYRVTRALGFVLLLVSCTPANGLRHTGSAGFVVCTQVRHAQILTHAFQRGGTAGFTEATTHFNSIRNELDWPACGPFFGEYSVVSEIATKSVRLITGENITLFVTEIDRYGHTSYAVTSQRL